MAETIIGTPLTDSQFHPVYGGTAEQNAQSSAWNDFRETFGRNPTQAELNQAAVAYMSSDPHFENVAGGRGWIANYFQQQNAPTALDLYNQQQQKYQGQASQHFDTVSGVFQSLLGRAPTQDELNHFGTLIASGQTDAYQLQQYLQQTPEAQNAADAKFRQQISGELNNVNQQFFGQYIQPNVMSQFASQGRDISGASTGLQFALANAAKEMQTNTQGYLANLSASQYGQNKSQATSDYQTQLAQQMGIQNASLGNQISNQNNLQQQGWNWAQNASQNQNLMDFFNMSKPRSTGIGTWGPQLGMGFNLANQALNLGKSAYGAFGGGSGGAGLFPTV